MVKLNVLKNDVRAQSDMITALEAADSAGTISKFIPVAGFAAIKVNIFADNSAAGTVKVWGSDQYDTPDFSSAVAFDNQIQQMALLDTGSTSTDPLTDITISADGLKSYEVNTNGLKWIAVELDARSAGDVSVSVIGYNL
jgi:hypothetical protein